MTRFRLGDFIVKFNCFFILLYIDSTVSRELDESGEFFYEIMVIALVMREINFHRKHLMGYKLFPDISTILRILIMNCQLKSFVILYTCCCKIVHLCL